MMLTRVYILARHQLPNIGAKGDTEAQEERASSRSVIQMYTPDVVPNMNSLNYCINNSNTARDERARLQFQRG
jgi:hypothetical protein